VVQSDGDEGSDEGDGHEERQFGEGEELASPEGGGFGEPNPNANEKPAEMEDADIASSIFMGGVGSKVKLAPHEKAYEAMVKVATQSTDGPPRSSFYVLVHKSGDLAPQAVPVADYRNLDRAADGTMCPFMQSHLNHEAGKDPNRENRATEFTALEISMAVQATEEGAAPLTARNWHTDETGSYLIIAHVVEVTEGDPLTHAGLNALVFSVPHPAEAAQVADEARASKEEDRLERELARELSKKREQREAAAMKRQAAIAASKLAAERARVTGTSSDGSAAGSGGGATNKSTSGNDTTQVRNSSGSQARNGASGKSPSYGNGHPTLAESKAKMELSYKQHAAGKRAVNAIDVEETDAPNAKFRRIDETKAASVKKEKEARRPLYPQRLSALFNSGVAVLKCVEIELRKARLDMNIPPKKEGRGLQVPHMFGSAMSRIFNLEEAVRSARQWREEREGAGRFL
jgi:hypothetical protein